jgi:trk system potassium uptake protein TrkH
MKINTQPISNVVGVLLIFVGLLMMSCLIVSSIFDSNDVQPILKSSLISIGTGLILWIYKFKTHAQINKREGYLIVAISWFAMALVGAMPYLFSGITGGITNAFFESVSGLTTTGATILTDIESVPKGLLFWRSMTQWIGGMGIIVLTVAIFPLLGIGGIELFVAEAPGPTSDKIHPRIKETAKRLWFIYLALTGLLFIILRIEGMTWFDSINHAMTTMATGGFSTKNASMAFYESPLIQYTIIAFMFMAGTNYSLIYHGLKGRFRRVFSNEEYKMYITLVIILCILITFGVLKNSNLGFEEAFRASLFQIISIMTTTGYITADYTAWSSGLTMIFFILLFVGACAGSTSGGIKLIRHLVFLKNSIFEFRRILHPRAMIRIKINHTVVAPRILTHILVFLLIYLILFVIGSVLVTICGMDFLSAIGAVATSLGNVGPGIGTVGPLDNFANVPETAKWILLFLMLLGRLELFTILVLFTPYFWRNN